LFESKAVEYVSDHQNKICQNKILQLKVTYVIITNNIHF